MDLPSFIWLWRIAAWSMGLSLTAFGLLALSGGTLFYARQERRDRPAWLRPVHYVLGTILVGLVLLLLGIGVIGTLGEYGHLGHSIHLPAGLTVVLLTLASAFCAMHISPERPWARKAHLMLNAILLFAFIAVTATGWSVVQKYL
ncbi:MAG: DUF4079 domain-containing protein [Cyanobacteria bacterium P01_F01_bin.53]